MFLMHRPGGWRRLAAPLLYFGAGLAASTLLRGTLGAACGALLVAAGSADVGLRWLDRRSRMSVGTLDRHSSFAPAPSRHADTTDLAGDLMPPPLGHEQLDRQHRSLAAKAATLRVALFHNDDQTELELLVHELMDAMARHLQDEADALARLGLASGDADLDADRLQLANAEYDLHLYFTGDMPIDALVERVAGPLVGGHLARRHPVVPSMASALQRLRDVRA